jgi:O-antigen/teichoic acid export membrane protein
VKAQSNPSNLNHPEINRRTLLIHASKWNAVGAVLPAVVSLPCVGAMARRVPAEDYGALIMVWALIGYCSVCDLGLSRAVLNFAGDSEVKDKKTGASVAYSLVLCASIIVSVLLILTSDLIVNWMFNSPATSSLRIEETLQLAALVLPGIMATSVLSGYLEGRQEFRFIGTLAMISGVLTALAPAITSFYSVKPSMLIAATALARAVPLVFVILHPKVREILSVDPRLAEFSKLKPLWRYGGWITVSSVVGPLMTYMDKFAIAHLLGVGHVTQYSLPSDLVNRAQFVPGSISKALFALGSRHQQTSEISVLFKESLIGVALVAALMYTPIVLFAPLILSIWLGEAYAEASAPLLRILALGAFINCCATVPYSIIQALGRPDLTAKAHVTEAVLFVMLIYFGAKHYGLYGVALASLVRIAVDAGALFYIRSQLVGRASKNILD